MEPLNKNNRIVLPTLLIGIGLITGLIFGTVAVLLTDEVDSSLGEDEQQDPQTIDGIAEERLANLSSSTEDSINDISGLVALLDSVNHVEQQRVLYNFVNKADERTIEQLFKQADDQSSIHLQSEIQKALVLGLAKHDPMRTLGLLEHSESSSVNSLIGLVFQEWAVADFDRAVAEAAKLDEPNRRNAVEGILTARYDLSETVRREIARQLGHEQIVFDQIAREIINDDILDPKVAWKLVIGTFGTTDVFSTAEQHAIVKIAVAWIVEDGNEALLAINDELRDGADHVALVVGVLEKFAKEDPHRALEMASTIKLRSRTVLSRLISSAATVDPRIALDAASSIPVLSTRTRLQQLAISSWVASTPLEVLKSLDQLPVSLRPWSQRKALTAVANESPKTAASFVATIEDVPLREYIAHAIAHQWAKHDHEEALRWVSTSSDISDWKESLRRHILRSLAQEDTQLAMRLALDQPITPDSNIGLEAAVIEEVAGFDVDQAIYLMSQSRNENTRKAVYTAIGTALVVKGRSELALELVAESPPNVQFEYFDSLGDLWALTDPEDLLEKLDSLPTEKISENLGTKLATINSVKQFFTPEQKKELKKFVPRAMHGLLL